MTLAILTIFGVGIAVGLLSGLVGIGGGVLIVPFLYFFYQQPELFGVSMRPELVAVTAHATSLFVIVPTSIRGVLAFHRAGLVEWRAVWTIGPASVIGAFVGARLAVALPPELLKAAFGALLVVSGARMAVRRRRSVEPGAAHAPRLTLPVTLGTGGAVGVFSSLMGVGGGIISIPLLIHWVGLEVRRVAATSIGIITITATAGVLAYVASGQGVPGRPDWSVGYVDVVRGAAMFAGSLLSVRWGAALNQRLNPRVLTLLFAVLFILIGIQLLVSQILSLR